MTDRRPRFPIPPIDECIKGRVYALRCRNLEIGVFDGDDGFIGIRTKFGSRYLFTEHHWDTVHNQPYGSVAGAVDLGIDLPPDLPPSEDIFRFDETTGRHLVYDPELENPNFYPGDPSKRFPPGWWRYEDTGEPGASVADGLRAQGKGNVGLFAFLDELQRARAAEKLGRTEE